MNHEHETCPACHQRHTPRSDAELRQLKNRISRMTGQLNGIGRMLDENRYCGDILIQLAAVEKAFSEIKFEYQHSDPDMLLLVDKVAAPARYISPKVIVSAFKGGAAVLCVLILIGAIAASHRGDMGPHWPVRGPAAARERGCAVRRRQNVNVSNSGVSNSGFPLRPHYTHGGIGCQPRFRRLSKERGPLQSKARPPSAAPKRSCFQIGPTLAPLKAPKIAPAPAAISGRGGSILRFGFCGGATAYWRSAQWPWQSWRSPPRPPAPPHPGCSGGYGPPAPPGPPCSGRTWRH